MHPKPPDRTRKWTHGARILPFLPRKACMRRRCCQEGGAYCAHSGERGRIRRDSCQLGPRAAAVQGRDARFYGAARWVTALGRATQRVAASAERARRAAGLAGTAGAAVVGAAVQGRGDGDSTGTHGATGAMEAGDGWPRGVGARSAQYASSNGGYSPKLASIAATRSSSAPMSC